MPVSSPIVNIFGFTTALGSLPNLVDFDDATFWAPYADGLDSYTMPPVGDSGAVIPGYPRPAIEFDFGEIVRVPVFQLKVEKPATVGQCFLIASDAPATSLDDTVQAADVWAGGMYTVAQMNSNQTLETRAKTYAIRKRYWRFVFWQQPPAA